MVLAPTSLVARSRLRSSAPPWAYQRQRRQGRRGGAGDRPTPACSSGIVLRATPQSATCEAIPIWIADYVLWSTAPRHHGRARLTNPRDFNSPHSSSCDSGRSCAPRRRARLPYLGDREVGQLGTVEPGSLGLRERARRQSWRRLQQRAWVGRPHLQFRLHELVHLAPSATGVRRSVYLLRKKVGAGGRPREVPPVLAAAYQMTSASTIHGVTPRRRHKSW